MQESALVKQEPALEAETAAAECEGPKAEHEVKQELAVGPELLQSPIALALQAFRSERLAVKKWSDAGTDSFSESGDLYASSACSGEFLMDEPESTASGEQLQLWPCTVQLERMLIVKKQDSNKTPCKTSDLKSDVNNKADEIGPIVATCNNANAVHTKKVFSCNFCGIWFKQRNKLKKHQQRCSEKGIEIFKSVAVSRKTGKKVYFCSYCTSRFPCRADLIRHKRAHIGEKPYSCEICGKQYTQPSYLKRHKRIHFSNREEKDNYFCDNCNSTFGYKYDLIKHMLIHIGNKKNPYKCEICRRQYSGRHYLTRHKLTHIPCTMNDKVNGAEHKLFLCDTCGMQFASRKEIIKHLKSCTTCAKKIAQRCDVAALNLSWIKNEHYSCKYCKKQFTIKNSLTMHERVHTGERPYKCEICKKQFTQDSHFKTHQATHNLGKKIHSCDTCGRNYAYKYELVEHMRIHSGEKPFSCNICGKRFSTSRHISRHKLTHNPQTAKQTYKCNVCEKPFNEKSNLIIHMRVHSGEKPYTCKVCGMSFAYCTSFLRHKKTHTSKVRSKRGRSHRCSICKYRFDSKEHLIEHVPFHIWIRDQVDRHRMRCIRTIVQMDCSVRLTRIPLLQESS